MQRLFLRAMIFATLGVLAAQPAAAGPKKALGDYSTVCQDEHLRCLNQCQTDYTADADIRACFGVCDEWLDEACDVVFPKAALKLQPGTVRPLPGVVQGMTGGDSGGALGQSGKLRGQWRGQVEEIQP